MADRVLLRRILWWMFPGLRHPSGIRLSLVNAIDPSFQPCGAFTRVSNTAQSKDKNKFNLITAITLGNLSKLAYEDQGVVAYELAQAGYNLESLTFISYHNTAGFVVRKGSAVVVAWRGTDPLNLMHIMTDLKAGMVDISNLDKTQVAAGRVHYGFVEALRIHRKDKPSSANGNLQKDNMIELDDEKWFKSAIDALFITIRFLMTSFRTAATKPVAPGTVIVQRKITAYQQVTSAVTKLIGDMQQAQLRQYRIYVAGHSLGGALATVFFTQSLLDPLTKKDMVDRMSVYSFGAPRIGNVEYSRFMQAWKSQIFRIVNYNDIIPRQPLLKAEIAQWIPSFLLQGNKWEIYADPPGTLVYFSSISSPDYAEPLNFDPYVPGKSRSADNLSSAQGKDELVGSGLPPIELFSLNGVLDPKNIKRIAEESTLWVMARITIPFFMFDHLCSEYVRALKGCDDLAFMKQLRQH